MQASLTYFQIFIILIQFNIKYTPLRLTTLGKHGIQCERADFKTYAEVYINNNQFKTRHLIHFQIDQLLNSNKEENLEEKKHSTDDEDFRPKPKLQKLSILMGSFWPQWWK